MNWRSLLTLVVLAAAWGLGGASTEPGTRPATATAPATRSYSIPDAIRAVRSAPSVRLAGAAYSRGNTIDRNNVALHEAYMTRMLQLGQPNIALYPARKLLTLSPDNGTAWAVVGYVEAKRKRLIQALNATVLAAEHLGDDSAVLRNAGQLLAWHANQPSAPPVSDAAQRTLSKIRKSLDEREAFAGAYRHVQSVYDARKKLQTEAEADIAGIEAEAGSILETGREIDRNIASVTDQARIVRDGIIRDQGEAAYLEEHQDEDADGYRRLDLYRRVRAAQIQARDLDRQIAAVRQRGHTVLAQLKRKIASGRARRNRLTRELARLPVRFEWSPPTVAGAVVPGTQPTTATAPAVPGNSDRTAAERFRLAGLYLQNGLADKARKILEQIVADYPQTPAAAKARKLIDSLVPVPKNRKAPKERNSP